MIGADDKRRIVRVFLASPGDLQDERRAAKAAVDEFNAIWADHFGYQIELVGWEDTVSIYGRPQESINRELARCEYFIGMIWKRWGTAPDTTGKYTSGFEEEFEISVENRDANGSPEMSLYFKSVDKDQLADPGQELKRVLSFKDKIVAEKKILYEVFNTAEEFQEKVRKCIARYVQSLRVREPSEDVQSSQTRPTSPDVRTSPSKSLDTWNSPIPREGERFLKELVRKGQDMQPDPDDLLSMPSFSDVDVARFRLLGNIIATIHNDEQSLGVHDSNIVFFYRNDVALSFSEKYSLLRSALSGFSSEVRPLWYWLKKVSARGFAILQPFAMYGVESVRVGAFGAMRLVSNPIDPEDDEFLQLALSEESPSRVKVAALDYLRDCGLLANVKLAESEYDRADSWTRKSAVSAILQIRLRNDAKDALRNLFELQTDSLDRQFLLALLGHVDELDAADLLKGIGHESAVVRAAVATALVNKNALTDHIAEQLIADSDANVRSIALDRLIDSGRTFSDEQVEQVLIQPRAKSVRSLAAALGSRDEEGEALYAAFCRKKLMAMSDSDLESLASTKTIYDLSAKFVLCQRQFTKMAEWLRSAADDRFEDEITKGLEELAECYGSDNDICNPSDQTREYMSRKYTREALDIISENGDLRDRERIRESLRRGNLEFSRSEIEYLSKLGEWTDIPLMATALNRRSGNAASLLIGTDSERSRLISGAIYRLGRNRFGELIALDLPSDLLARVMMVAADSAYRKLTNGSLASLFANSDPVVRKVAVLKCIRALPKSRLESLLNEYVLGATHRYYNVVHWLDFGCSNYQEVARSVAKKLLSYEWDK